jgi:hypothetical protein
MKTWFGCRKIIDRYTCQQKYENFVFFFSDQPFSEWGVSCFLLACYNILLLYQALSTTRRRRHFGIPFGTHVRWEHFVGLFFLNFFYVYRKK